jgi:hypothetical protein
MAKNVRSSVGSARTGVDVTNLSSPDISAAGFVRQSFADDSSKFAAQGIAGAIDTSTRALGAITQGALDIDEGFAKAKVERDVEDQIQGFQDSRDPEFQRRQAADREGAATNLFTLEQQQNAIFSTFGAEGVDSQDTVARLNALAGEFTSEVSRFKRAQDQGVMSQTELELNVLKVTREAINRRPGLARELTQHAEQTLNLSGARELASFEDRLDQDLARQESQAKKDIETQARGMGIFFDPRRADHDNLVVQIQGRLIEKNSWDALKQQREENQFLDEEQAKLFIETRGQQAAMGGYAETVTSISALFSPNMSDKDFRDAKLRARLEVDTFQGTILASIAAYKAGGDPAANKLLDNYTTASNRFLDILEGIGSGDEAKRVLQNQVATMRAVQDAGFLSKFDEPTMNAMIRLSGSLPFIFESQDRSSQQFLASITDGLIKGSLNTSAMQQSLGDSFNTGKTDLSDIVISALPGLVPGDREEKAVQQKKDPQTFERMIETTLDFLSKPGDASSDRAKFSTLESITKEFGTEESRQFLNNATLGTKASLGELYNNYAQVLTRSRDTTLQQFKDQGIDIQIRLLPDGRLVYESEDTAAARSMNTNVGARFNELIDAYAVLFNQSRQQTSSLLGKAFSGGSASDIANALDSRSAELAEARETQQAGGERFMDNLVQAESGGDPFAKAKTSSATGLAGFTEETFLNIIQREAPELTDGKTRSQILELREDGNISRQMAQALADDNGRIMARANVETTDRNLYLSHFLGVGQAVRLIKSKSTTAVENVVSPQAVDANKEVLQGKTVQEVLDWAQGKMK